jgi:hypothetical protein
MKKSIFFSALTAIIISSACTNADAQSGTNDHAFAMANVYEMAVAGHPLAAPDKTNLKAVKNFQKAYGQAANPEWSLLDDKSLLCLFSIADVPFRAFYNPNGSWSYTVSSYDAKKLDKAIHDKVQSVYFDYRIVYVNQIDLASHKTIYLVEIQDEKSIKKLRVTDDEMDVIQDFQK